MTDDPRYVAPKAHAKKERDVVVRDNLLSECLLSLITAITIISCLMIIRVYVTSIKLSMYSPYILLLLALMHTFIRRSNLKNVVINLVVQLAVSVVFYIAVYNISIFGFALDGRTRFYLVMLVVVETLFSLIYRLKPTYSAADLQVIFFPAAAHLLGWLFFKFSESEAYSNSKFRKWDVTIELATERVQFARLLVINAAIIAVMFLVMRQLAVFDKKYYHSIQKKSQSNLMLKKQNYITVIAHLVIVLLTFGAILIFPYTAALRLFWKIANAIARFFNFLFSLLMKIDTGDLGSDLAEESISAEMVVEDNPLTNVVLTIIAIVGVIILLGIIMIIATRVIKNSIKYAEKNDTGDDSIIDIIESIGSMKNKFARKNRDFGSGYERRIRKQFYDKTRNAMKKGLPVGDSSTPGQIETVLLDYGDEEISELRQEYEKVRYGQQ